MSKKKKRSAFSVRWTIFSATIVAVMVLAKALTELADEQNDGKEEL